MSNQRFPKADPAIVPVEGPAQYYGAENKKADPSSATKRPRSG